MKDDILTAVKEDPIPTNVAPIAPLPSRLSFCFSPKQTNSVGTPTNTNIPENLSYLSSSPGKSAKPSVNESCGNQTQIVSEVVLPTVPKKETLATSPDMKYSPTKLQNFLGEGSSPCSGVSLSTLAAVKRSPTVAPSISGRMVAKGNTIDSIDSEIINLSSHIQDNISTLKIESPSKRCLRISISCDNYLGDGKSLSISNHTKKEDDISDNSPYHSCKGSPLRWAAKADELTGGGNTSSHMTSSLIVNPTTSNILPKNDNSGAIMTASVTSQVVQGGTLQKVTSNQRSCSANHLDLIVDILGVPSELLTQRDFNKRLFLLEEGNNKERNKNKKIRHSQKHNKNPFSSHKNPNTSSNPHKNNLKKCGKSKSCEDESSSNNRVVIRHNKRAEVEAKRRSVYLKECKGRSETQHTCTKCIDVAQKVNDLELNKEIFHIPTLILKSPGPEVNLDTELMSDVLDHKSSENLIENVTVSKIDSLIRHQEKESHVHINVVEEDNEIELNKFSEDEIGESNDYFKSEDKEKLIQLKSPKHSRKFDAVRTLLEKARQKLLKLSDAHKHLKKGEKGPHGALLREKMKFGEVQCGKSRSTKMTDIKDNVHLSNSRQKHSDEGLCSQSSPVTPAEVRRKCPKSRNRSFSPVR